MKKYVLLCTLALLKHGIAAQDSVDIELFDHLGTPIEEDTFPIIIEQFHRCENFCVVIEINTKGVYTFSSEVRILFYFCAVVGTI